MNAHTVEMHLFAFYSRVCRVLAKGGSFSAKFVMALGG